MMTLKCSFRNSPLLPSPTALLSCYGGLLHLIKDKGSIEFMERWHHFPAGRIDLKQEAG